VSIASRRRGGGGDGGDLEGWESARVCVGGGKSVWLAARRSPRSFSDVPRGTGAPDLRPWRRGQHGVADDSIGLDNWPAPFLGAPVRAHFRCRPPKCYRGRYRGRRWRCSHIVLTPRFITISLSQPQDRRLVWVEMNSDHSNLYHR
jgi:hypothetical protein